MATAAGKYQELVTRLENTEGVLAGQMFGKPCLKIHGKAFAAQHKETVVFKLAGAEHARAIALKDAVLWDPSGKGRPMKAWVALPVTQSRHFDSLADAALACVTE
ncbi:MAG TPA: hypothetical protein VGM81_26190 [Burkholderiaceae bacterium]